MAKCQMDWRAHWRTLHLNWLNVFVCISDNFFFLDIFISELHFLKMSSNRDLRIKIWTIALCNIKSIKSIGKNGADKIDGKTLTVFALALLDERFVFDVIVTRFAIEPRTENNKNHVKSISYSKFVKHPDARCLPFDFVGTLCYKKTLGICLNLSTTWINRYFTISSFFGCLDFDSKQK